MTASPTRRAFWLGVRDALPFIPVIVPFGMVFGALAGGAGWTGGQIVGMSGLVIAGASQFTALQLLADQAPLVVVIATALAVNLRMAMYSASMAPYLAGIPVWQRALISYALTDQTYGLAINRYGRSPGMTRTERVAHFAGLVVPICGPWYVASYAGAVLGAAIPPWLALDFAVPITFIALFGPWLRDLPHVIAGAVSFGLALALVHMPYSLGLLVAAVAAMLAGALAEVWRERAG